ncbi:inorganic phosphate transporter [Devosia sp. SL43]|uniref:inorganic phosphate transporter n=1 Tax=Devosia sp. SL43 TaxID=2806348 RepID=UPI001F2F7ACD|nr:inorganic phosphate transporter [Devosia sp. SL43]UJW86708.1 inorganic phosphate transporter [Devosia sp. SL43]
MPRTALPLGIALVFLLLAGALAMAVVPDGPLRWLVVVGAMAAGYMALNVGANDVANNMGPAVGARAITMVSALALAAAFDAAGALLAGGEVIETVAGRLLTLHADFTASAMILVMIAALVAAAAWINLSTFVGAPVSTTHAIVGGVVGAAVAAGGTGAVAWPVLGTIAVSWIISPLLGALFAAVLHTIIRTLITRRADKMASARTWVPVLVGAMSGIFAVYLTIKAGGFLHLDRGMIIILGLVAAGLGWLIAAPRVRRRSQQLENRKKHVARLFRAPLIVAAALLSFAHGSNDTANAIGPLMAILDQAHAAPVLGNLPFWSLAIGAFGIALGIALFGPRVIHTVGEQITKLNEIRAFCVALSAATTVLAASAFGLPVSSTHVAVGAVFGVGFLREYLAIRDMKGAAVPVATEFVDASTLNDTPEQAIARERRYNRRYLVRRLKVARIFAAWLVTLPAAGGMGALGYWLLDRVIA